MMKTRTLIVCLIISSLAIVANATLIDFESVPENQSLQVSNQYVGDTYDVLGVDLWSKTSGVPKWRYNVYNNNGWFILGDSNGHIGMDFDIPASEVSMDLMAMSSAQFWVFDENDSPISGVTSIVLGFNVWKNKTIIAPTGRLISRIEVQGTVSNAVLAMDNLTFVPEPATLSFLALGGLVLRRRRRA
jgi:hypothetical protein